jgi:hypothetical protein
MAAAAAVNPDAIQLLRHSEAVVRSRESVSLSV